MNNEELCIYIQEYIIHFKFHIMHFKKITSYRMYINICLIIFHTRLQ